MLNIINTKVLCIGVDANIFIVVVTSIVIILYTRTFCPCMFAVLCDLW